MNRVVQSVKMLNVESGGQAPLWVIYKGFNKEINCVE